MSDPERRPLPPERRNGPPRWEVVRDRQRLGIIVQEKLGGARLPFYEAIMPHPVTGRPVSLELDTGRDDRARVVVQFTDDPEAFRRHWV